jgi:diguanylate cyclase (GGDEF)-like protein/PAS domain S-box-containing protein
MEMGQKVPPEILARVLGTEAEGTYEAVGSDGVPRLYGFRQLRLEGESAPYTVVIVGFDKRELLAKAAWGRNLNIMFLFFAAMLAIALASKISQISVLRPVRLLIETAQRIGAADLGARTAIPHVSGEMGQLASAIDDMATSLQQKARDLQENEARYKQLVENANDMIFRFDLNGRISFVNPVTRRISGYSEGEILGHSYADFLAPEDRVSLEAFYREQFLTGTEETYQELPFVTRDGRMIWLGSNVQLIRGEDGRVSGFQAISRDITERKRMEEELEKAAITDALTGLYNRRGFLSLAQRQMRLAERSRKGMILCFIDLDGMKDINDRLGHEQGDAALTETAAVLTEVFRESDILARIGGDEFAVLAIDSSADHEDILRNRLYERVARHNGMAGRLYILSMSCGMAFFDPEAPVTMDDLMAAADIRMYEQKRRKKGAAGKKESPHAGA